MIDKSDSEEHEAIELEMAQNDKLREGIEKKAGVSTNHR
jgi:hypothetical protein